MLKFDKTVDFVNQISAFAQNKVGADSCIELLNYYEQKWNVEHIAPQLDVYIEDYIIKIKSPSKFIHVVGLPDDESIWQKHVVQQYYGFLSDTHLVLDTIYFSDRYDIIFSNKYLFYATARAWGEMYAVWANQNCWLNRKNWKYVDFYNDLTYRIDSFSEWAEAAYKIIVLKTEQKNR